MSILSQFKQSQNTDFPNVRPSLDLRFALTKKLDPRITFTRGSTGTYFGSDGILRTAGANEPRFDHDPITGQSLGLLIEESRSNLVAYSEDFSNVAWFNSQSSIVASSIVSPSGSTSFKLVENTISGVGHFFSQSNISKASNAVLTFTIFAKVAERQYLGLVINSSSTGFANRYGAEFNLGNGTARNNNTAQGTYSSGSFSIQPYPNGWYRCTITCTTSTDAQSQVRIFTFRDANQWTSAASYAGDGTSGIYIWGAQLEAGAFPTSYIPTTASTVTRSVDNADMTGTNFSSWYNQSEGTIVISTDKLYSGNFDAYRHLYKIDSGSSADAITAYTLPGATTITNYGIVTGGRQVNDYQQINIGSSPTQFKMAQSVNSKYFFFTSSKGTTPPQLPSKSAPNAQNLSLATNMSRLFIGSHNTGGQINSHIARFTYYPIQLTNQQLINLCS